MPDKEPEVSDQVTKLRSRAWREFVHNTLNWSDPNDGRLDNQQFAFKEGFRQGYNANRTEKPYVEISVHLPGHPLYAVRFLEEDIKNTLEFISSGEEPETKVILLQNLLYHLARRVTKIIIKRLPK